MNRSTMEGTLLVCHENRTAMRWRVFTLVFLAWAGTGNAQPKDDAVTVRYSRTTGLASFITPADNAVQPIKRMVGPQPDRSIEYLRRFGHLFGITDPDGQLRAATPSADSIGHTHTKYEQFHNGVRVFAGVVRVHVGPGGGLVATNGDFFPIAKDFDTQPTLDGPKAVEVAGATIEPGEPTAEHVELVIVDPGWYGDAPIGPHLAYYVILSDPLVPLREAFFVGARSGKILDRWNVLHTARFRRVFDGDNNDPLPGFLIRSEGQDPVPGSHADVDRAYDYGGDVYDYFFRAFGRDSFDDLGSDLIFTVNSTAPPCANAFWDSFLQQMVFCSGTVTDDITAHEMTHGVIDFSAALIYQNQSGQLNESYADVFGELVDLFNGDAAFAGPPGGLPAWPAHLTGPGLDTPNNPRTSCSPGHADGVRWLMGEDAAAFGGEIRDMWDPTCFGDPDRANSPLQSCDPTNAGGVHSGSGIPNHAFAMLTDGKTFNGQAVVGIGPIKAGAVWYRALTTYLTPGSDFEDAYLALNQAALDLIGATPLDPRSGLSTGVAFTATDAEQVDKALLAVEMNTPGRCGQTTLVLDATPPIHCANQSTIFADDMESGANGWTVETGPTPPPTEYDWVQTSDTPAGGSGTAWFGADANIGDCSALIETAVHSLISPFIELPAETQFPVLSFRHYYATEAGWDGGNIKIQVDGGPWELIPGRAFLYNPYYAELIGVEDYNANPKAGEESWTGWGAHWGFSLVDLSGFAVGGQTIRIRFEFGKDGCVGIIGWYVDEFEVYDCPDCDQSGQADLRDFQFAIASGPLGNIGAGSPQVFSFPAPEAAGEVVVSVAASGDFSLASNPGLGDGEYIDLDLRGTPIARAFDSGAPVDCPVFGNLPSYREQIRVPAADFNNALLGGVALINLIASPDVNPQLCKYPFDRPGAGSSYVSLYVQYPVNTPDCSGNLIPDSCEPDEDSDGLVDACDLCPGTIPTATVDTDGCPPLIPGDFERDGDVDLVNFSTLKDCLSGPDQVLIGGCEATDLSGDGRVDLADFSIFEGCFSSENQPGDPTCAAG